MHEQIKFIVSAVGLFAMVVVIAVSIVQYICSPYIEWYYPSKSYYVWGPCFQIVGRYDTEKEARDGLSDYLKNPSRVVR
jgi:hypothetical protein